MSTDYQDIRRALEKRLLTVSGLTSSNVAFENAAFDREGKTEFYECSVQPVMRRSAGVGITAADRHDGLFLINGFFAAGVGAKDADNKMDAVLSAFDKGVILSEGGKNIRIAYSERGGGFLEGKFFMIPMTVTWYSYI